MLPLNPKQLESTYDWLCSLPPFRAWKLPPSDDVEFFVTAHRDRGAHYRGLDWKQKGPHSNPEIAASINGIAHYWHLAEAMAHEMIHFYLDRRKMDDNHGPNFQRVARRVCNSMGWDLKTFLENGD